MDILSAIANSITLVQRLREITGKGKDAEAQLLLVDLSGKLADIKLQAEALQMQIVRLQEQNTVTKLAPAPEESQPVEVMWGCYLFKNDESLYCPVCWDGKRTKIRTIRAAPEYRLCPVCRTPIRN